MTSVFHIRSIFQKLFHVICNVRNGNTTYPEMARLSLILYFCPINIFVLCISGYVHTFILTALDNSIKNMIDMLLLIALGLSTNKIFVL